MLVIPPEQLSVEALGSLIEEFVTRDGTDYGDVEVAVEVRVGRVRRQLERGEVHIVYDEDSESATLLTQEQLQQRL